MAEHIAENLWRLDIPLVGNPLKNLNSYLIVGERSLLIDTGFRQDPCREAMERQLTEIGVDRDKMDIFVTHLHSDHAGLAPELVHPGCVIYMGKIDGPGVATSLSDHYWENVYKSYVRDGFQWEEIDHLWNKNPAQRSAPKEWVQYDYLDDGAVLSYGGHDLRCILTPGHTPGHLCLYDAESRWFFAGDHILFDVTPNICRWKSLPDALGSYLDSLQMVRNLPVDLLLTAHRTVQGTLADRVDELTAHHAYRIEECFRTVEEEPGMTAYDIAGRMRWKIRARRWEDFPLTQKYFAVGEALAHLDYLELRGRVTHQDVDGRCLYYPVSKEG